MHIVALVEAGSDINAVDRFQWSPLMHAISSSTPEVVERLLIMGAAVDGPDQNGGPMLVANTSENFDDRYTQTCIISLLKRYAT